LIKEHLQELRAIAKEEKKQKQLAKTNRKMTKKGQEPELN
jgi:hypothetical protein